MWVVKSGSGVEKKELTIVNRRLNRREVDLTRKGFRLTRMVKDLENH